MKTLAFCLTFAVIITLVGCTQQETRDYIGKHGEYRITVPGEWEQNDELNKNADLCLSDKEKSRFLVIQSEKKSKFSAGFVLEDYFEHAKDAIVAAHNDCVVLTEDSLALQFTAKAFFNGTEVRFYVSVKESKDKFWQLVFWSEADDFEDAHSVFITVSDSFNATDGISLNIQNRFD